ncbi:type VI secretion system contractile sheath small subunit [Citrobacter cronae]|uniref:type VI secretion system contractile sheath small subunit n=1 Tax=Citrobacter cronae TaxID=1748967 RepID=UPI001C113347|nr:type VI secretion system contractile sheath small subunit [Citrobacter cronae]MBU5388695.1 type VI secretion system contractile sheath small subunit [Citrobacter cronae]
MMNTQHKLDKVRPPRVQITYDVEEGDAQKTKELPLVIGVIGDFYQDSGGLRERKFINIDKDSFNKIMSSLSPMSEFLVESVLPGVEGKLPVSIAFENMDDFSPDNIVQQVEPLKKLLELRIQLSDLRNRTASNEILKEQLGEIVLDQDNLKANVLAKIKNEGK